MNNFEVSNINKMVFILVIITTMWIFTEATQRR